MLFIFDLLDGQTVTANGTINVPVWILGSSLFGASLAAALETPCLMHLRLILGLQMLSQAVTLYHRELQTFSLLATTLCDGRVLLVDSDEEAAYQFTSAQQKFHQFAPW